MLLLLCAACGRKGALIPPEARVPAAVSDLKVAQQGGRFVLSWTPPSREQGGAQLREPTGFALYRREVLPPSQDCDSCPDAYRLLIRATPDDPRAGRRVAGHVYLDDTDLVAGKTYQYQVQPLRRDGTAGQPSNRARRRMETPPAAPTVAITPSSTGVTLVWSVVPPTDAGKLSYNVYRRTADGPFPPVPLNSAPLTVTRYEDSRLEPNITYRYGVRSLTGADDGAVESVLSNEVAAKLAEVEFR
jgi:predicted small lipoprotein YifL